MIVYWSAKARARVKEIYDYIGKDSPLRAQQVVDRLTRRSESLALLPRADQPVPEYPQDSLRDVLERPFRIIFISSPDRVDVVTVKHYQQRLPERPADLKLWDDLHVDIEKANSMRAKRNGGAY